MTKNNDAALPAQKYIPGVCNIGPAERAKRRQSGYLAAIFGIVLLILLAIFGAAKGWRIVLILPFSAAASGFLQDAFHFCAGFGMKGLYNVVNSQGITDDVTKEEYRQKDKRKALSILALSFLTGAVLTVISLLF